MGRHISRRLSDGVTSIVGDFNHEKEEAPDWALNNAGVKKL